MNLIKNDYEMETIRDKLLLVIVLITIFIINRASAVIGKDVEKEEERERSDGQRVKDLYRCC